MVRKVKQNTEEITVLSEELKKELEKVQILLNKLENNINSLNNGDIWNGINAYEVNKSLTGHFDHDKTLLSKLEKCSETLEIASK